MASSYPSISFATPGMDGLVQPPGTPSSCTESETPLPTSDELRAMGVEQLTQPIDPHLLVDLQGMGPAVMHGLMTRTAANAVVGGGGGAASSSSNVTNSLQSHVGMEGITGGPPPPLGVAPPLGASLVQSNGASASTGRGSNSGGGSVTGSASSSLGVRRGYKGEDSDVEKREKRKQLRAERNRQSAASSRERKKRHLRELQRRLEAYEAENKILHAGEFEQIKDHLARIQRMLEKRDNMAVSLNTKDKSNTGTEQQFVNVSNQKKVPLQAELTSPAARDTTRKPLRKPRTWDSKRIGFACRNFPY